MIILIKSGPLNWSQLAFLLLIRHAVRDLVFVWVPLTLALQTDTRHAVCFYFLCVSCVYSFTIIFILGHFPLSTSWNEMDQNKSQARIKLNHIFNINLVICPPDTLKSMFWCYLQYVAIQRKCWNARHTGQFENALGSLSCLDSNSSETQIEHLRVWLLFGHWGSSVLSLRRVTRAPGPDPFLASPQPALPPAVWKDGCQPPAVERN